MIKLNNISNNKRCCSNLPRKISSNCPLYSIYVIFSCIRNSLKLCETARKCYETGSVNRKKRKIVTHETNERNIIVKLHENPYTSLRQLGYKNNISTSNVFRTLHAEKFHPFRLSVQVFHEILYCSVKTY